MRQKNVEITLSHGIKWPLPLSFCHEAGRRKINGRQVNSVSYLFSVMYQQWPAVAVYMALARCQHLKRTYQAPSYRIALVKEKWWLHDSKSGGACEN